MKRRELLKHMAAAIPAIVMSRYARAASAESAAAFGGHEPMASGPFSADWKSLSAYRTPDWFRNAKFGIWAHWGPQCEPEFGDWYARGLYEEGNDAYKHHLRKYGHPSVSGFKDVIRQWKADRWDPDSLVALYKKAGAKYFMALANHRKTIGAELKAYAERVRDMETAAVTLVLRSHGIDLETHPPIVISMLIAQIARSLCNEDAVGVTLGHDEMRRFAERQIDALTKPSTVQRS